MTIAETRADLVEEFSLFDDWEDRYRYVISLGETLAALKDDERVDANKVSGCASQVWLKIDTDDEARLQLRGDSDSQIVKGLAAILARLYHGKSPTDAVTYDPEAVFADIGLADHLTAQRANGLKSMIARIRAESAQLSGDSR